MKTVSLICLLVFGLFCPKTSTAGNAVTLSLRHDRVVKVGDNTVTLTLLANRAEAVDIIALQADVESPLPLKIKSASSDIPEAASHISVVKASINTNYRRVVIYTMANVPKKKGDLVLLNLVFTIDPSHRLTEGEKIDFKIDNVFISDPKGEVVKCNFPLSYSLIVGKSELVKASK